MPKHPLQQIAVLLCDNVYDSAIALVMDVLTFAQKISCQVGQDLPYEVQPVSLNGKPISTASGQTYAVKGALTDQTWNEVIIPGIYCDNSESLDDLVAAPDMEPLYTWLAEFREKGGRLSAGCTGVYFLAKAGLLDEKEATTTWWLSSHFEKRFPEVHLNKQNMVIDSDGIRTAGAAMAHMDLSLALVLHYCGAQVTQHVAQILVLDERTSQARYMAVSHLTSHNKEAAKAERWIRKNLQHGVSVSALARYMGFSTKTLARKLDQAIGMTPVKLIQKIRMEQALHLARTTQMSHEEIAAEVGYEESSSLRKVFRKELDQTLSELK